MKYPVHQHVATTGNPEPGGSHQVVWPERERERGDPTPRICRAEKLAIYSRGGRPTTAAPVLICAPGRAPKDRGAADTEHLLLTSRTTSDTRRVPGKDATDGSPRRREDKPPPSARTEARRRPSASIASRAIGHLHLPGEGVRPPLLPSADAARQKELPPGVRIVQHLGRLHCRPPVQLRHPIKRSPPDVQRVRMASPHVRACMGAPRRQAAVPAAPDRCVDAEVVKLANTAPRSS
ncbi:hypothetical protein U9M48_012228 [Paspalum notatum var. saurae]|uniref:Uncharacterized protein n=1 Tax=Paspalum notatum var. saurae TaxID=547442 RepID=A0AAQ3SXE9_PASNO